MDHTQQHLISAFTNHFLAGRGFKTIVEARADAATILGEQVIPGTPQAKLVDECIELVLVQAAQGIANSGAPPELVYKRLVDLYNRQPTLGTRSSTSIAQQAYSTPIPIAYIASQLAGIAQNTIVYEPTAGNGSLLLATERSKVISNELDPLRAANLQVQGYLVTQYDATNYLPNQQVDVVIANPPFGSVQEDGRAKLFEIPNLGGRGRSSTTTQIDQAIALNALRAMKDDGRAVLILGGKMGDERSRSNRYNSQLCRSFYYTLYQNYNVVHHISIDGDLYSRQGADFPIDLIVIQGRGKSQLRLPAADVPRIYHSFNELQELLSYAPILRQQQSLDVSFERTDGRHNDSSISTARPERDIELQRVPGVISDALKVDDPATEESATDADADRAIHQFGGNVLPSPSSIERERTSAVGDRLDRGKPVFSREAELRAFDQLSSLSDRESNSTGSDYSDEPRGMVTIDGARTEGGLDVSVLKTTTQQEIETVAEVTPEDIVEQPRQVPYEPLSRGSKGNTLVPINMRSGTANALRQLEQRVGSLDEYVADRLNYGSPEILHRYFNAEQVDAIALDISNLEKRRGFIIGDQTGVGKGRVVAATLRYAKETARIPIFVTKDPVLYADMMRDLADIGMPEFRPFITNSNLNIPLSDGRRLRTTSTSHQKEMQALAASGGIGSYDAVFTTYSQLQSVKAQETQRRDFLRAIAPNAILVLDESHEAGGSKQKDKETEADDRVPDRAEFVRELLSLSQGGFYSSATFAKRPDVMDLYFLTDMGQAVSTEKLVSLVERGGIPMQQGLATMLVETGQYIRRERSYEGVSFEPKVVPVEREMAERMSSVMAAILDFDRIKQDVVKDLAKELKAEAKSLTIDNATGSAGVDSTNFTSIMHNIVEQSLLANKAEASVSECLQALRNNEKPVIALASTMGSVIGEYAKTHNLSPGEPIDISFQDLLKRYLERTRDIIVKDFAGNSTRHRLSDEQLGAEAVAQYEAVLDEIEETEIDGLPISPIDYIKARLVREGYKVAEVTGRTETVDYDTKGNTTYSQRASNKATARNSIEAFNSGQIDVMILNRSGATGISLHASERFADQRQRHMVVVQPEKDINQFMQMLGRIHRTGQVILPKFTLLMADIPAEKRPNAVLLKKMASLNANTTAARRSGISLDSIPDFLNDYGDQLVAEIVGNNPELNHKLGYPLKGAEDEPSPDNAIARVTGRIPLLPLAEQEAFYDQLEGEYKELVERQEAMGESILEANTLDLDARTVARLEAIPADQGSISPFTSAVYLEVVDAKTPRKPLTTLEVANVCRHNLELESIAEVTDYEFVKIGSEARANAAVEIAQLKNEVEAYRPKAANKLSDSATQKLNEKLDKQLDHVQGILQDYPVGERVRVVTSKKNVFYGVVARVWETGSKSGNPVAPANWRMQILLADQARELTVPLSKVNSTKENAIFIMPQSKDIWADIDVYDLFDSRQTQLRQERQIFTGNLVRAYEAFDGKLVNFTDNQGKIRQGVLTAQDFDIEKSLESQPVRMPSAEYVKQFINETTQRTGSVKTFDELLTIKAEKKGDGFVLQAPKARDTGSQYYLDSDILTATGADFYSVGDRMECLVPPERLDHVLEVVIKDKGLSLAAFDQRSLAREMLGIELPKLQQFEPQRLEVQVPEQGLGAGLPQTPITIDAATREVKKDFTPNRMELGDANEVDGLPLQDHSPVEKLNTSQFLQVSEATLQKHKAYSIAAHHFQVGIVEKNVAKLLHQAGLADSILKEDDFYLKVENNPYTPLSIERHGQEMYLTHFLADSYGDLFIDSEMVFDVSSTGQLKLTQTAVQNPFTGGESRRNDREFGKIFSQNLLQQGFGKAALRLQEKQQISASPQAELPVTSPDAAKVAAHKLAEAFGGEVVEDFTNIEPPIPEPEYQAVIPSATRSEYPGSNKPLAAQETQLNLFDLGLNNISPPHKLEPPFPTVLPQTSNQTSIEIPATQPVVQALNQNSALPSLKDISVVDQEVTLAPVVKPDLSSDVQQPESASNQNIASIHAQHLVAERSESFSERASQVRDIDLETVALDLGLERDKHDKHKWRGDGQIISINGGKFYDHLNQKGSGGAIDLVMHVQDCQYKEAVEWLSEQSATLQVESDRSPTKLHEPFTNNEQKYLALPVKDETKWLDVQTYLVETRGLPEPLVNNARQLGLVYADPQRNAVFLRHTQDAWERGETTGASLRGTRGDFRGLSPGCERDKGWFWFGLGKGEVQRVVLVESAIDALSFAALDTDSHRQSKTVYLSADGAGAIPIKDLQAVLERGGQVIVAYDADRAGEQMAWKVTQSLPGVTRLQPNCGKDWNEQLLGINKSNLSVDTPVEWSRIAQALGKPESYVNRVTEVVAAFKTGQPLSEKATAAMQSDQDAYKQSLDSLWKWHSTANALGKSSQYLNRISEVALAFSGDKPSPLSADAMAAMQRDRNVHQVVDTSQKVLQHLGKPTGNANGELLFRGKNFYQVQGVQNNFRLDCHERGLILVVAQGRVQKSDLTNDDFERFHVLEQKLEVDMVELRKVPVVRNKTKEYGLEFGE